MTSLQWLITLILTSLGFTVAYTVKKHSMSQPTPDPTVPPTPTPTVTLNDFLKYQWQFEWAVSSNNNPGNYRYYYGGYLPMYEPVGRSVGGFAMFPTLPIGEQYAIACTKNVIKSHPDLTILTYISGDGDWEGYAPASDHNPVLAYANFIAKGIGVSTNFLMRDFLKG